FLVDNPTILLMELVHNGIEVVRVSILSFIFLIIVLLMKNYEVALQRLILKIAVYILFFSSGIFAIYFSYMFSSSSRVILRAKRKYRGLALDGVRAASQIEETDSLPIEMKRPHNNSEPRDLKTEVLFDAVRNMVSLGFTDDAIFKKIGGGY